jgi:MFS family permease
MTSAQASGVTAGPYRRSVAAGGLSTVLASLPVFLLGGLAVLVRDDLGFTEVQLGLAASTFFSVAALTAVPAGRVAARTGAWAATVLGAATSAAALLAVSAARSYAVLLLALAVAGVANALAQLGTNGMLADVVPKHRQGLAFGIKQAAIPAATLVAGFSLPLVGLTLGWRDQLRRVGAAGGGVRPGGAPAAADGRPAGPREIRATRRSSRCRSPRCRSSPGPRHWRPRPSTASRPSSSSRRSPRACRRRTPACCSAAAVPWASPRACSSGGWPTGGPTATCSWWPS